MVLIVYNCFTTSNLSLYKITVYIPLRKPQLGIFSYHPKGYQQRTLEATPVKNIYTNQNHTTKSGITGWICRGRLAYGHLAAPKNRSNKAKRWVNNCQITAGHAHECIAV